MNSHSIVLASASPRRHHLLKEAGINFTTKIKDTKEEYPSSLKGDEVPLYLAKLKGEAFKEELSENEIIITADTVVLIDGKILGKPETPSGAKEMLQLLSGKKHDVLTGVFLLSKKKTVGFTEKTEVYFRTLEEKEIEHYLEICKPFDKAGSYGIQDWIGLIGVEKINGSYFNVMGLPISRLYQELKNF